jgi:hypothetical protein
MVFCIIWGCSLEVLHELRWFPYPELSPPEHKGEGAAPKTRNSYTKPYEFVRMQAFRFDIISYIAAEAALIARFYLWARHGIGNAPAFGFQAVKARARQEES